MVEFWDESLHDQPNEVVALLHLSYFPIINNTFYTDTAKVEQPILTLKGTPENLNLYYSNWTHIFSSQWQNLSVVCRIFLLFYVVTENDL